ncbi:hypothetical protein C8R47DRAFT_1083119 [Mycena vitilis]|nr:hypothetical protein C8R47DRAFT_1083119 [Mycena vitilis]
MSRPRTRQALARRGRAWGKGSKTNQSTTQAPPSCAPTAPLNIYLHTPPSTSTYFSHPNPRLPAAVPTQHPALQNHRVGDVEAESHVLKLTDEVSSPPTPPLKPLQAVTNGDKASCGSSFPAQGSEGLALKLLPEFPRRRRGGGGKQQRRTGSSSPPLPAPAVPARCPLKLKSFASADGRVRAGGTWADAAPRRRTLLGASSSGRSLRVADIVLNGGVCEKALEACRLHIPRRAQSTQARETAKAILPVAHAAEREFPVLIVPRMITGEQAGQFESKSDSSSESLRIYQAKRDR